MYFVGKKSVYVLLCPLPGSVFSALYAYFHINDDAKKCRYLRSPRGDMAIHKLISFQRNTFRSHAILSHSLKIIFRSLKIIFRSLKIMFRLHALLFRPLSLISRSFKIVFRPTLYFFVSSKYHFVPS